MICPVCNKKNKGGVSVCVHCGAKLFIESLTEEESRSMVGKYKMSLSKKFLIGSLAAAVVLIVVLLVLLLRPAKTQSRSSGEIVIHNNSGSNQTEQQQNSTASGTENNPQENSNNTSTSTQQQPANNGNTAEVMDYRLRMRQQPSTRSRIVEHLPKGAIVNVLEKSNFTTMRIGRKNVSGYWYKVRWEKPSEDGRSTIYTGWVWGKFLKFNNSNG